MSSIFSSACNFETLGFSLEKKLHFFFATFISSKYSKERKHPSSIYQYLVMQPPDQTFLHRFGKKKKIPFFLHFLERNFQCIICKI